MKKSKLDREFILELGILAFLLATGIVFFVMLIFDIQTSLDNLWKITGCYSGTGIVIWAYLLCRFC